MRPFGKIGLDKRWADYFIEIDDFLVDQTHLSFKLNQFAFRDYFANAPVGRYRPPLIPYCRADTAVGQAAMSRRRVFSSTRGKMRMPRPEPMGIPPQP
eukprot:14211068-Alexandrium_andersonii.AAC.1